MNAADLQHQSFLKNHLKYYENRAGDFSEKFLKWFLEHIFRLDPQEADDATVDARHDKGVDAIYVDDVSEKIHIVQAKTKTSANATLGDTDLKSFFGTLQQFRTADAVRDLIDETKNERLKQALERSQVLDKIKAGYEISPVFITNVPANKDAHTYLNKATDIELFDATRIASEYVDLEVDGGISESFYFDTSDTGVIEYDAGGASARIFLAPALNILKMSGIADGRLFEQNVRLSLGNTKVNRSLRESIRKKGEHNKFPLYHNGINVLCEEIVTENEDKITVKNYVVVNGAQSLTSLLAEKAKISDDLKILVKLIEVKGDIALSQSITRNSNNQNAIKARDLKSNHNIQQRLKLEIDRVSRGTWAYEIKQGEDNRGKQIITNENAGLILLAMDLEQPWSCHQKYRVMDELHSDIFGRPGVSGGRVLALWEIFVAIQAGLVELENKAFSHYTLARYFLAYSVMSIVRENQFGSRVMNSVDQVYEKGDMKKLTDAFRDLSISAATDLNAEISSDEDEHFDYKRDLKNQKWCKQTATKIVSQYKKDVHRKRAEPIDKILKGVLP